MDTKITLSFDQNIIEKAKDFAAEITVFNTREKNLSTEIGISREHVKNNQGVRKLLLERDITPEKSAEIIRQQSEIHYKNEVNIR